jgi:putative hydrolase of the HAD superfamily
MKNIKHYIFDLDNTLYPSSGSFFPIQMDLISKFIVMKLDISYESACILRDRYYIEYGTTMNGLVENHNLSAKEFHHYVDNVPLASLVPDKQLNNILINLPAKKYIFTNGSDFHAKRVMKQLELDKVGFDGIVTIDSTGQIPKPDVRAYEYLFNKYSIKPEESIFFEDSSHNLITAGKLGMLTVLIEAEMSSHDKYIVYDEIQYFAKSVVEFFEGNYAVKDK